MELKLSTKVFPALIDSGASVSLIEEELVNKQQIKEKQIELGTASVDGRLLAVGTTDIEVKLGSHTFVHKFIVVKKLGLRDTKIILGLDAVKHQGISVLSEKGVITVKVKGETIPWLGEQGENTSIGIIGDKDEMFVASQENIVIPPNSSQFMPIFLGKKGLKNFNEGDVVCVQPLGHLLNHTQGTSVTQIREGAFRLQLINPKDEPVRIRTGTNICSVTREIQIAEINTVQLENNVERIEALKAEAVKNTPKEFKQIISDIIECYSNTFVLSNEATGECPVLPFRIETKDETPIHVRPYRIPHKYEQEVKQQIQKMEKEGIIEKAGSPWQSPVVVVKKKDGSARICVDYRKLNAITVADTYPLPQIEEILVKIRNSKFFSTLDLKSGYHQIVVRKEDRPKTSFAVADQSFQFRKMPFGARNAPSHFSRVIQCVLAGALEFACLVYLDDIIILGHDLKSHVANMIRVLDALKKYNLRVHLLKCQFFQKQVVFLGHLVSANGVQPLHDKLAAIRNYPTPKSCKEVSSFLGCSSYYRRFIKDYAKIARPLDALRRTVSNNKFKWEQEHQDAFDALKTAITSDAILVYPDFTKEFLVTADASKNGIGGVVSQITDGRDRPIGFCSRALKTAEVNYSVLEKEALAILFTLERHKYILLGYPVRILSDHEPLTYLFKKADVSGRQARWIQRLSEFHIVDLQFKRGANNVVADALSRNIAVVTRSKFSKNNIESGSDKTRRQEQKGDLCNSEVNESTKVDVNEQDITNSGRTFERNCMFEGDSAVPGWEIEELIEAQKAHPLWREVRAFVRKEKDEIPAKLRLHKDQFTIESDVLYLTDKKRDNIVVYRAVLPDCFIKDALQIVHDCPLAGHRGIKSTLYKAREQV